MKKLIYLELKKILPYTTFWVFVSLYVFLIVLGVFWVGTVEFMHTENNVSTMATFSQFPIHEFPDVWHNVTYIASFFAVIAAILVIVMVSNEYEFRTLRQNLIDGISRSQFVFSKFLLILLFSVCSTLFVSVFCISLGIIKTSEVDFASVFTDAGFALAHFVQILTYLLFALLIALLVRRSGLAIVFLLVYSFVIFPILINNVPEELINWLPLGATVNLIQFPFSKYFNQPTQTVIDPADGVITIMFGAAFLLASLAFLRQARL